ncbi:MAG: NPCBM/NEW2 domain-containing protein [Spirochaetes bacterium]|nr:NPCBM/NEW2 domain-containing protein [Spirochaetota bacterium]
MNAEAHFNIYRGAWAAMPEALRQKVPLTDLLLHRAANYPDHFDDPTKDEATKAAIDPDWRRFTEFPEGFDGPRLHFWPHPPDQQSRWQPITRHWLGRAVDCFRAGDTASFVKYLGCLSHWAGDVTQSSHLMDLELLRELMPPPDGRRDFHYHTDLEAVTGECLPFPAPAFLGGDAEECAWRVSLNHARAMKECRRHIIPTLRAIFLGDEITARAEASRPVTRAAQLSADLILSAWKIAEGAFTAEERARLGRVDLASLPPEAEFHDLVYGGPIAGGNRAVPPNNGPLVAAKLREASGGFSSPPGFGMLPHSGMSGARSAWMRFSLPTGVFRRFTARVGMHAELAVAGAGIFSVILDDREAFRSPRLTGADDAVPVVLDLGGASSLTLVVEDGNEGRSFWKNHGYWAEPELRKD